MAKDTCPGVLRCRSGFRSEAGPACRSTATGLAGDAGHASPGRWRRTGTRRWAMPRKGQGRVNSRRHHRQNCTQWRRTARVEGVRCRPDGDGSGSRCGGSAGVGHRSGGAPAAARRRVAWGVAREGGGPKIEEGGTGDFDWPTFAASGTSVGPPLAGRDGLPRPHVAKLSGSRSTGRGRCMALVRRRGCKEAGTHACKEAGTHAKVVLQLNGLISYSICRHRPKTRPGVLYGGGKCTIRSTSWR